MINFSHISVLLSQSVDMLSVKPDGIYVDGTAGGGGHSAEILKRLGENGRLFSIDRDPDAIETVTKRFEGDNRSKVLHGEFAHMKELLLKEGIEKVDGVILDLGVSSHQLDTAQRGFSFHEDAPLDMRMSQQGTTAADLVNTLDYKELCRILSAYGEEKYAPSIVRGIIKAREEKPIETTLELAEIVKANVPQKVRRDGHPARKTFQAIRIAVNDEFGQLERGLASAFDILKTGGRLSVITFHSIEDRIVKQTMAQWCVGCTCPKDFPVCVCGNKPKARLVNKKPVEADDEELDFNKRSRSAKLRGLEKLV